MITYDLTFFALAIPAVIFAGISKAGFGSGAAFAAAAILALVLPPGLALGVMLPLLMLIDVASLRPYWGRWHAPSALWLVLGAVPGVAIAAWVYSVVAPDAFRVLIGLICIAFVAYQIAQSRGVLGGASWPFSRIGAAIAGSIGGFTSFVSHAGGPPVAVFLLGQGMSKTAYQATTVIVFWIINILKFVPYFYLGIFSWDSFMADLILAPFALFGAWVGVRAHFWIPERPFFALTYLLLIVTGVRLLWIGLT